MQSVKKHLFTSILNNNFTASWFHKLLPIDSIAVFLQKALNMSKKSKKNLGGIVFSTNPDYEYTPDKQDDLETLPPKNRIWKSGSIRNNGKEKL